MNALLPVPEQAFADQGPFGLNFSLGYPRFAGPLLKGRGQVDNVGPGFLPGGLIHEVAFGAQAQD